MTSLRRMACLLAFVFLGLSTRGWAQQPKITKITCGHTVGQWAVDEATGRIFASVPDSNLVIEYDPATGKELRQFAVPGEPTELIVKGHWLAAACPRAVGWP